MYFSLYNYISNEMCRFYVCALDIYIFYLLRFFKNIIYICYINFSVNIVNDIY